MTFYRNFFLSNCSFLEGEVSKRSSKYKMNVFIVLETNIFAQGTNALSASDERFSAGDERVQNVHSNFTHTHTASYQRLSNKTCLEMIATHRLSPPKMGGSYHALILTIEYGVPTSYISNSVLCWTKWPSSRLHVFVVS